MEGNIIQIIREYNIDPKNGKFQYKDTETVKKHFLMLLKIEVLSFLTVVFIYFIFICGTVFGQWKRRIVVTIELLVFLPPSNLHYNSY